MNTAADYWYNETVYLRERVQGADDELDLMQSRIRELKMALQASIENIEQLANCTNTLSNQLNLGNKVRVTDFTETARAALAKVKA